jgi:hypothetical protein
LYPQQVAHVRLAAGTPRTTTMIDRAIDLAAFFGILHMLINLNFPVMTFEYQYANLEQ